MVVDEDRDTGDFEWLPDHPLAELLEDPSPDYDMAELLARTQVYVDITGSALWLKDRGGLGNVGRLTPYTGSEFEIRQTSKRIRGEFQLKLSTGDKTVSAEEVVYFHELNPSDWHQGTSLVDVSLGWLNLSTTARAAVKDILSHALFPSLVMQADPQWNPDEDTFRQYQRGLDSYARRENRGKPLAVLGGGKATVVSLTLEDLIPTDILEHVESVVASVSGIPAVVLQFLVGLKNSPWSQMAEARRMAYEDTIEPLWREYERRLTRQLLRAPVRTGGAPLDADRSHYVRFDTSKIRALQIDKNLQSQTAERIAAFASYNEQRALVELEPSDDPEADKMPWERAVPVVAPEEDVDESEPGETNPGRMKHRRERKDLRWALFDESTRSQEFGWQLSAMRLLERDSADVLRIVESATKSDTRPPETKEPPPFGPADAEQVRRILKAIDEHMDAESAHRWREELEPLIAATGRRGIERLAAEFGLSFDVLQPGLLDYVQREAAWLVTQVTDTTKQEVRDALAAGLLEGESIPDLANRIRESGTFARSRAELLARTETTRVTNGGQREALATYQAETGQQVRKSWLSARDARVRDSHRALDGEARAIDETFSNGLQEPGEPNCRCTLTYELVEAEA